MPSTSDKQKRLMAAVANSPKFAKEVGIPQSVGKEFQREDKKMNCGSKRRMAQGGMTGFKPCAACPNEAACAAKGKCMLKGKGKSKTKPKAMAMGGKVRGCGMAKKGVRPARMV